MDNFFIQDKKRAVDAKFEAQKIAFAPIAFQATLALRDLGILEAVSAAKAAGITVEQIASKLSLSAYGVGTLLEMGMSLELVKLRDETEPFHFVLGKVGHFMLYDRLTQVNMDFVQDVCYEGAFAMKASILEGKPEGLKVFGSWKTIYEGLSSLPAPVKKSWFAFDHFYSDLAFPEALSIVFKQPPKHLFDIGGNTAKWALSCFRFNPEVRVTILDLPGQSRVAQENIKAAGAQERVFTHEVDMLDPKTQVPTGADAVWMSQFLDCFSLEEVTAILSKIGRAVNQDAKIYVLEPFWDKQPYTAAAYSLHATSLYFTTMANGNSKMYHSGELTQAIEKAGFMVYQEHHNVGSNAYSLMVFKKRA